MGLRNLYKRWFKPWPFDPQTLEVANNLKKGDLS